MVLAAQEPEVSPDEFVPLPEIVTLAGVGERTVRKRLRMAEIEVWQHPADGRKRLVRRADVTRLFRQPRPIPRKDHAATKGMVPIEADTEGAQLSAA